MTKDYEKYFKKPSLKEARKRLSDETVTVDFDEQVNLKNIGLNKTYMIHTYGCQGNEADSETIKGILDQLGFKETNDESQADFILLNTCAIRENAENRVFGELGRLKKYKRTNPDLILAVSGCMPQEEKVVERLLKSYPHVDLIFGTHNIHKLPYYIESVMYAKERVIEVFSDEGQIVENLPKKRDHKFKAWVNIMFGCDEFCTYCIVPYTRGKERSRDPKDIIDEVAHLASEGYKEVTLLGQNVNAYGKDFTDKDYTFKDLLHDLSLVSIPRIRFTTSHPRDFDEATVKVIAESKNIMPHIHLPVQSGSNHVLKKMNRKYTKEMYLDLVDTIYKYIPHASITTDIIVGFPYETNEDFEATLDLVERSKFEGAFTFIFSSREGTPASRYEDLTPMTEKKERLQKLNKVINEGYYRGNQRFLGEVVDVLVDGESTKNKAILAGYTPHNKLVNFKGDESLIGQIVKVKITEAKTWFLLGERYEDA
jgi:tRNA-2-methylthio-N6-dimethylallyladenosine synthase